MIKLYQTGERIPLKMSVFPAGETFLRIQTTRCIEATKDQPFEIHIAYNSNTDLIDMMLLVDAIRRQFSADAPIALHMPYMPYARQDRVMAEGESLSIAVVARIINAQNFLYVATDDLHSDVSSALIDRLLHTPQHVAAFGLTTLLGNASANLNIENIVLVSPDAGANKKVFAFAKAYNCKDVARADKLRDPQTGAITNTVVYSDHIGNKDFLILDDICDGGRTFTELAKVLRPLTSGKILLYVTHGIFSKGMKPLMEDIDHVYTANLMNAGVRQDMVDPKSDAAKFLTVI